MGGSSENLYFEKPQINFEDLAMLRGFVWVRKSPTVDIYAGIAHYFSLGLIHGLNFLWSTATKLS